MAFYQKKLKNYGSGAQYVVSLAEPLDGSWVVVVKRLARNSSIKLGLEGLVFITDNYEAYHRIIPEDQLFTGKDLTFPIEQDNSDVRHHLARMTRKTKVVSKSINMVDILRIFQKSRPCEKLSLKISPIFK